jgi:hypothetical protein
VADNIERAAGRATDICGRVVFRVTGKMEEIWASGRRGKWRRMKKGSRP